jgi:hypothetical protein
MVVVPSILTVQKNKASQDNYLRSKEICHPFVSPGRTAGGCKAARTHVMIIFWSTSTSEIQLILLNKSWCQDTWWLSKYILAHMICSLKPLSNWVVLRPLHFPQTRDWSTISYLPPSKLKKERIITKPKMLWFHSITSGNNILHMNNNSSGSPKECSTFVTFKPSLALQNILEQWI